MAYDKVVDSAQLEAAITASANAIREKTGDAALIQWVANKGFAEAIAAIESGGGLDISQFGFTEAVFGSTVGSNSFTHNLGKYPKCVFFWSDDEITSTNSTWYVRAGIAIVMQSYDGSKAVREAYSADRGIAADYQFYISAPSAAIPRTGFDVIYSPNTTSTGMGCILNAGTSSSPNVNAIFFNGKSGGGQTYKLCPSAEYHWGVFA